MSKYLISRKEENRGNRYMLLLKTKRKSYIGNPTKTLDLTLSDLERSNS